MSWLLREDEFTGGAGSGAEVEISHRRVLAPSPSPLTERGWYLHRERADWIDRLARLRDDAVNACHACHACHARCHRDHSFSVALDLGYLPNGFIGIVKIHCLDNSWTMEEAERIASDGLSKADHLCVLIHG